MMILGFVSFVMFILKDQSVVDDEDEEFSNTFDVSGIPLRRGGGGGVCS